MSDDQPIDEARLKNALREITGDETTSVVICALNGSTVSIRTFGSITDTSRLLEKLPKRIVESKST